MNIAFPLAGPSGPIGVAEVRVGPRSSGAALDWKAFFVDQVVQTWEGVCGRRWPLGADETFIWTPDTSAGPALFGPSANLACLLAVARVVARSDAPFTKGRIASIWATGKLSVAGELERVEAVKDKVRMFARAARARPDALSLFFVPRANAADLEALRRDGEELVEHVFEPRWVVPSEPGVAHVVAVRSGDVAALVDWAAGPVRARRRWFVAGVIITLVLAGVGLGWALTRAAPTCHGYDRPEPAGPFAASVEAKLNDAYAKMGDRSSDLEAVRDLFVRATADAKLERDQADEARAQCAAEGHWASGVYYQAFVDYLELLACAAPGSACDEPTRQKIFRRATDTLDGTLDYFLLNEARALSKRHRRIALRDWLQIMIDLRFGGLGSADLDQRIADFVTEHPCSDNQQGLLLLAALLADARGDAAHAHAALERAADHIDNPPLVTDPACRWFDDLDEARQKTLIGGFGEIAMPEHRACYANGKPGQPARPLLCAAHHMLAVGPSPHLDAACRAAEPNAEAEHAVATLRANLQARREGRPWTLECRR